MSLRWRVLDRPEPALTELLSGQLHGLTLRGALPAARCAALAEALPGAPLSRHRLLHGEPPVVSYGHMLAPSELEPRGADSAAYLADAEGDRPFFQPLEPELFALLTALSGLPAQLATLHDRPCALATVRALPPGRGIPLHRDTYNRSPIWEALAPSCDPTTRLSWYLALNDAGGQLQVSPQTTGLEYGASIAGDPVPLRPGDLVLFDAGRLFHQVSPGQTPRLTLGGFAAPSADMGRLLVWA